MIEEIVLKSKSSSFNQIVIKDNNDYKNLVINLKNCDLKSQCSDDLSFLFPNLIYRLYL